MWLCHSRSCSAWKGTPACPENPIPTPRGKDGRQLTSHSQILFCRKYVQQKVLTEKKPYVQISFQNEHARSSSRFTGAPCRRTSGGLCSPGVTQHTWQAQLHNPSLLQMWALLLPGNLTRCPLPLEVLPHQAVPLANPVPCHSRLCQITLIKPRI